MCGICAVYNRDRNPVDRELLTAMTASLSHRGPDDQGVWYADEQGVGLGHRRLTIVDLSAAGRQPMANEDGTVRMTFNGEIYNWQELREEAEARGHRFRSRTDCEVILHLYEDHDDRFFDRLNGIFAFVLFDARRGRMLAVRDQMGVKPLYYCLTPEFFVCSSELKTLLLDARVNRDLDPRAIADYMTYLWAPSPRTMLESVKKLPAGHAVSVEGERSRVWRWWDLPYGEPVEEMSLEEAALRVRSGLERAVERQLMSDVPLGAFLSGGLDSSSVVAMMKRLRPDSRPRCYSIGFAPTRGSVEGFAEDLPYARRVARDLDVDLREIFITPRIADEFEGLIYHLDEPQADAAPLNVLLICKQARAEGIKVLLSGAGGDDIFSGYRRHQTLQLEGLWRKVPLAARRWLSDAAGKVAPTRGWKRRLRKLLRDATLSPEDRILRYFDWNDDTGFDALLGERLREQLRDYDRLEPLRGHLETIRGEKDPLRRLLYLEAKTFLPDHNLNYTDKLGMASGVEVRVPFLDVELVRLAVRLPSRHKLRGFKTKYVLKKAMTGILSPEVISRPKTGFGAPLRDWITGELDPFVRDLLSPESLCRRGLFEPHAVHSLIEENRARRVDASYLLWGLMSIEMWLRLFSDAPVRGSRSSEVRTPALSVVP
ncbi:MAG TPA: asparagine synthase (glutamine-hydrolyzing) [Thermoanaerobaculia bacterium]|jgi:asparagine synthase (glutamine-hydrolysing)